MSDDLRTAIKTMIVERLFLDRKGVKPADIADGADLMETFGIDSVALFEIVVGVEEDYGVAMGEEDFSIEHFQSVDRIVALIEANA
ncbi:MAG: acyl carrier protein [Armatimonadetes bacterium]|nr:acyl carrier protein [Armatimonadota bacterium]